MNYELKNIKQDWVEVELGELLKLKNGFAFKAQNYIEKGIPVFRIGNINNWLVSDENAKKIEEKLLYDDYIVENGDILIAMSGATTGKFGIYNSEKKAYQNQRVGNLKLHSNDFINKNFVFYLLYSLKRKIEEDAYGGAQPNISATKIEALTTNLAPLPIQRAIVKKIETLFSDLDNGIANLKKAQEQLKIYRQAVLKKAFEGELTKEWRDNVKKIHEFSLPTAEELLKQIKQERKNNYELQITNWKKEVKEWEKNGKEEKKPTKPKAIKELPPLTEKELKELPKLPEGWKWCNIGDNFFSLDQGWSPRCENYPSKKDEWGVIKTTAIQPNSFEPINNKKLPINLKPRKQHELKNGDILITRAGPRVRVGVSCLVKNVRTKLINCDKAYRIRNILTIPEFIVYLLNSPVFSREMEKTKSGISDSGLNLKQDIFLKMPIPLPPLDEQTQIVQEIESRLSVCDKVEQSISESLEKSKALRQSILKKAFEGKLLSEAEVKACKQEKDYEPASVLLEKIKAEKLAKEQEQKRNKKNTKKKAKK